MFRRSAGPLDFLVVPVLHIVKFEFSWSVYTKEHSSTVVKYSPFLPESFNFWAHINKASNGWLFIIIKGRLRGICSVYYGRVESVLVVYLSRFFIIVVLVLTGLFLAVELYLLHKRRISSFNHEQNFPLLYKKEYFSRGPGLNMGFKSCFK